MKKLSNYLVLSSFILIACSDQKIRATNDKILFEKDTLISPLIPIGDSITYSFIYQNVGSKGLRIKNIGTACNCTVVNFDSAVLNPGERDSLRIKYVNSSDAETVHKTLVVETDSEIEPLHALNLILRK
jgi:hypothetical protein